MGQAKIPTTATLKRYGLSAAEWQAILDRQHGVCAICGKLPDNGMLNIDHEHVKGWRRLRPDQRKEHVRGLVCPFDNHYCLGRYITIDRCRRMLVYLEAHESRRQGRRQQGGLFDA